MKNNFIELGPTNLTAQKRTLEGLLRELYIKHYGKARMKHASMNDKRIPHLKITEDIFSSPIFFKDMTNQEHRMMIDGLVRLDTLKIQKLSLSESSITHDATSSLCNILKELSVYCDGYILFSLNGKPKRFQNGKLYSTKELLSELVNPDTDEKVRNELFQWFYNCENE